MEFNIDCRGRGARVKLLMTSHLQELQKSEPTTLLEIMGVPTHANTNMTGLGRVKMHDCTEFIRKLTSELNVWGEPTFWYKLLTEAPDWC